MTAMPANPRIKLLPDGPFIEIDGGSLYLGRDCHLAMHIPALLSKVVSNRHLCIRGDGVGPWTLEDLGSTNGTWLRGERLPQPSVLRAGDVFSMGRAGPQFEWIPPEEMTSTAEATMLEEPILAETVAEKADGSDERPYRVGITPEVKLHHTGSDQEFSAKGYTIVIGRDPVASQILIRTEAERHVSGRHAEIQFRSDGSVVFRDLDSRNGSWVNDRRVKGEVPIARGDRIVLGAGATTLVVKKLGG